MQRGGGAGGRGALAALRAALLPALLAGCSALPTIEDVVPPPPPDPAAVAEEAGVVARALAGAAGVCLGALAAGETLSAHVARRGPQALGVRPAPAGLTGWVVATSRRANLYEGDGGCRIEPVGAAPEGTTARLLPMLDDRLAARGIALERTQELPGGLVARRYGAPLALTLATEGQDGRPVLLIVAAP